MRQELVLIVLMTVGSAALQFKGCDFFLALKPGSHYTITSPQISRSSDCRWVAKAPPGYRISLACSEFKPPSTLICRGDKIIVSVNGRADLKDGKEHCGNASFVETTVGTKITVALKSDSAKLKCSLKTVPNSCNCGQINRGRIGECTARTMNRKLNGVLLKLVGMQRK